MDRSDWLLATMLAGMVGFAFVVGFYPQLEPADPVNAESVKIPVEEARFMLECTQDWGLTSDECRAVLYGGDAPVYDGYGC